MLVLTRKCGEEIVIDGSVRVSVVQCKNGRVRLGIDAPTDVRVMRSEIAFDGEHRDEAPAGQSDRPR